VDNVDFVACRELGIPIAHTPGMFGAEVADVAVCYTIALARRLFVIDRRVRLGHWPKPVGLSLLNKVVALVGFGDIGRNTAHRLLACGMKLNVYDPSYHPYGNISVTHLMWPDQIEGADFILLTCSLNHDNRGMINSDTLNRVKRGAFLVNVSRGALVDEEALISALNSGRLAGAALDVFEKEPVPAHSRLREIENVILGSHNASNTVEAIQRTSIRAMDLLFELMGLRPSEKV
jgi:D-3-phosphoglycerate dehydrogenase